MRKPFKHTGKSDLHIRTTSFGTVSLTIVKMHRMNFSKGVMLQSTV